MSHSSAGPSRVMVFGGTFDPPHRAHVDMPIAAARHWSAGRLIYVPASVSPHKTDAPPVSTKHRVNMLKLALSDVLDSTNPKIEISLIEIERGGPSFFVDTIEAIRDALPGDAVLSFLIGTDQLISFHRWKHWERILGCAQPVVLPRLPWVEAELQDALEREHGRERTQWWMNQVLDVPTIEASSTDVRAAIARGDLDPRVRAYIEEQDLYSNQSSV